MQAKRAPIVSKKACPKQKAPKHHCNYNGLRDVVLWLVGFGMKTLLSPRFPEFPRDSPSFPEIPRDSRDSPRFPRNSPEISPSFPLDSHRFLPFWGVRGMTSSDFRCVAMSPGIRGNVVKQGFLCGLEPPLRPLYQETTKDPEVKGSRSNQSSVNSLQVYESSQNTRFTVFWCNQRGADDD